MMTAQEIQAMWNETLRGLLETEQPATADGSIVVRYADKGQPVPFGALARLELGYSTAYLMAIRQ